MYLFYYITQVTKQNGSSSLAEKKAKSGVFFMPKLKQRSLYMYIF